MLCRYELPVVAICPVDQSTDVYEGVFVSEKPIMVERIREVVQKWRGQVGIQENITQALADDLGCTVTTTGVHSTVKTTVVCSPRPA
jgi:GTP cyclohydrolase I